MKHSSEAGEKTRGLDYDKTLLILPCMPWNSYGENFEEGRFWKSVLQETAMYSGSIDVYAIDCIRLKSSNRMIGLWSPYKDKRIQKEILDEKLDSYPSWSRYKNHPELREELKRSQGKTVSVEREIHFYHFIYKCQSLLLLSGRTFERIRYNHTASIC